MFLTLFTIYEVSALFLVYILYKNVGKLETELEFVEAIWHFCIIVTPIANTFVVLLVLGWDLRGWINKMKVKWEK